MIDGTLPMVDVVAMRGLAPVLGMWKEMLPARIAEKRESLVG